MSEFVVKIDFDNEKFMQMIDEFKSNNPDFVEVVRCKDCKHCDPENWHCDHFMGTQMPFRRNPDDFCSYGDRKDGDE